MSAPSSSALIDKAESASSTDSLKKTSSSSSDRRRRANRSSSIHSFDPDASYNSVPDKGITQHIRRYSEPFSVIRTSTAKIFRLESAVKPKAQPIPTLEEAREKAKRSNIYPKPRLQVVRLHRQPSLQDTGRPSLPSFIEVSEPPSRSDSASPVPYSSASQPRTRPSSPPLPPSATQLQSHIPSNVAMSSAPYIPVNGAPEPPPAPPAATSGTSSPQPSSVQERNELIPAPSSSSQEPNRSTKPANEVVVIESSRRNPWRPHGDREKILLAILAFLWPPLGAYICRGCGGALAINIVLSLLTLGIGGIIHAEYLVFNTDDYVHLGND